MKKRRLILCFFIVAVNIGPAVVLAWNNFDKGGLIVGLLLWLTFFFAFGASSAGVDVLNRRHVRRALFIIIALRALPCTWPVDYVMWTANSTTFTGELGLSPYALLSGFEIALRLTIGQGLLVAPLFGFPLLVLAAIFGSRPARTASSLCEKCGYDLRASPVRCPECGTPNARPGLAALADSGA